MLLPTIPVEAQQKLIGSSVIIKKILIGALDPPLPRIRIVGICSVLQIRNEYMTAQSSAVIPHPNGERFCVSGWPPGPLPPITIRFRMKIIRKTFQIPESSLGPTRHKTNQSDVKRTNPTQNAPPRRKMHHRFSQLTS